MINIKKKSCREAYVLPPACNIFCYLSEWRWYLMELILLRVVDIHMDIGQPYCPSCRRLEKGFDAPSQQGFDNNNTYHMITLMEAYNNGTLLQYIMDICCSSAKVDTANDYETSWNGHQPLTPMKTTCSKEEDAKEIRLSSASELRFERKRRKRGVIISSSPLDNTTGSAKQVNNYIKQGINRGVINPHYNNKPIKMRKKWQPSI